MYDIDYYIKTKRKVYSFSLYDVSTVTSVLQEVMSCWITLYSTTLLKRPDQTGMKSLHAVNDGFLRLSCLRSHCMLETIIHNTTHAGDNAGVFSRIVLIYLDSLNIQCRSNVWGHKEYFNKLILLFSKDALN